MAFSASVSLSLCNIRDVTDWRGEQHCEYKGRLCSQIQVSNVTGDIKRDCFLGGTLKVRRSNFRILLKKENLLTYRPCPYPRSSVCDLIITTKFRHVLRDLLRKKFKQLFCCGSSIFVKKFSEATARPNLTYGRQWNSIPASRISWPIWVKLGQDYFNTKPFSNCVFG